MMPRVKFTTNLKQFFPTLTTVEVQGSTVTEVVAAVNERWDGLRDYIVDEHGRLRRHVNIFVGEDLIHDKVHLSDAVNDDDVVYIMQALSGG
jgi:molybdopterin converting factor small subunit